MTTFNLSLGRVFDRNAATHVVRQGMNSPWTKRVPTSIAMPVVIEHARPHGVITSPPIKMIGLMGNLSAAMPSGQLESAIPRITAEMVKEAYVSPTPNSERRIGNTG